MLSKIRYCIRLIYIKKLKRSAMDAVWKEKQWKVKRRQKSDGRKLLMIPEHKMTEQHQVKLASLSKESLLHRRACGGRGDGRSGQVAVRARKNLNGKLLEIDLLSGTFDTIPALEEIGC